MNTAFW